MPFSHYSSIEKVKLLRAQFDSPQHRLDGYLITNYDQHTNEVTSPGDRRVHYMTGYSGCHGLAIVTRDDSSLWVDNKSQSQASREHQIPFNLSPGAPNVATLTTWIAKAFPKGGVLGASDVYVPTIFWESFSEEIGILNVKLVSVESDLVNLIWKERPQIKLQEIVPHPISYTGKLAEDKVAKVVEEMKKKKCDMLVLSELDDIAWLLNLRGSDINFTPVFFSFLIVRIHFADLYSKVIGESVRHHLFTENVKVCDHDYYEFYDSLTEMAKDNEIQRIWISDKANYRLYRCLPSEKVSLKASLVSAMKCIKTDVEASGMIEAHVYDGYAMCKFFAWLNKEIKSRHAPTEASAAEKLEQIKKRNSDYVGPSFKTISASGVHTTIPNYEALSESKKPLNRQDIYVCSSGSQYRCGTTDVTRTYHFGKPTEFEKECYTRVFLGQVNVSSAVFPESTKCSALDTLARQYLWKRGLDFNHSAGHGIGCYLNVREPPVVGYSKDEEPCLSGNMFITNEPSCCTNFGVKLGNVEHVVPAPISPNGTKFLTFENVTLCPYQPSLLLTSLLSADDMDYLNQYNEQIRKFLCPVFQSEDDSDTYNWVMTMTEPLVL